MLHNRFIRWSMSCALLITLLNSLDLLAQPNASPLALRVNANSITIDRRTGLRMNAGQPFSGTSVRYAGGRVVSEESFLQGRRHGTLKKWFPSGHLAFESHYVSGRRDGTTRSWWSNGSLRSSSRYVNDKLDGEAWRWYRSGEKFKKLSYDLGEPVGLQQAWRKNGKLFSNFEYRNGRAYGLRNSNMCVELADEEFVLDEQ